MRTFNWMIMLAALCVPVLASAQGVYKHVDKDGKVYYSDKPPTKDDPRGKKIDVDTKRNVIPPLINKSGETTAGDKERVEQRLETQNRLLADLEAAKGLVAQAKADLEAGKTPLDDEWMMTVGGRRIPNDSYHDRVAGLERALAKAEAELAKADNAYRRGVGN